MRQTLAVKIIPWKAGKLNAAVSMCLPWCSFGSIIKPKMLETSVGQHSVSSFPKFSLQGDFHGACSVVLSAQ